VTGFIMRTIGASATAARLSVVIGAQTMPECGGYKRHLPRRGISDASTITVALAFAVLIIGDEDEFAVRRLSSTSWI